MPRPLHLLAHCLLLATLLGGSASAADHPLLMPGKTNLYQRVLATPGAQLRAAPGSAGDGQPVTPFTAYYVYARQRQGGSEWLQVGTDRHGGLDGWLAAEQSLEWNQGLTVVFRDPIGHDRSLLFRDADALRQLIETRDLQRYDNLYLQAESDTLEPDSPVVAIQPARHIDIHKDFYLVPIRQHEDVYLGSEQARLLQVSSVPLQDSAAKREELPATEPAAPAAAQSPAPASAQPTAEDATPDAAADREGYTSGLVFVIDATLSMDPYIDRTREAVMKIYDRLGDSGLLGNVNFGLVAFRDNTQVAPGLEYLARTYVTLEEGRNPGTFLAKVNDLSAATASSRDFNEDVYAGVKQAIDAMDWEGHHARYIVLITDAGAREAGDPLGSTGLSAAGLRQLARDKGVAIFVLHLLTPAVMADHPAAAAQYKALSDFPGIGSLYYGVPTGDVQEFGTVLDALAGQITDQVRAASTLEVTPTDTAITAGAAPEPAPEPEPAVAAADNPQLAELQAKVAKLGYALRLQYLRRDLDKEGVPTVFDAWLLDRDFRKPERRTLDVRVLLTRDQLSDLHDILRQVLVTAEEGLLSPQGFLDELQSLAATLTRDPEQLGATTAVTAGSGTSLADLGFMREYIEGLPYTGEVMNLSLEDWQSWPAKQQIGFLHRLEEKIGYYRALHDHTDLWVSLDG
ncbi:MAG: serine/threonine-protein kinase PpkA, partial [Pseudomonadota bacterium]